MEIEGKKIIEVKVKEGGNKPYYLDGIAYKRVGTENPVIAPEELERIILDKRKRYWDSDICEGVGLEDIDEEKVKWFLKEARRQRGLRIPEDTPLDEALMRLKVLRDRKLTNSAVLLFRKESEFIQSEVKCIRFDGNKPVKPYIDFQTLGGNVFDLVDKAEDFVLCNIRKAIWLVPGQIQREEKHEYPPDAIREAIVNAIVHRNYSSPSKVQIRIFDDRIEVWNPGRLPEGWTVEKLKEEHESIPKNPLLFKQFFWVKYVEDVGGGTIDMINECRRWGIPDPEFEDTGTSIVVTFKKPPVLEDLEKLGLNDRQIKAVGYIVRKGSITNREYQKLNSTIKRTATRDLTDLVKRDIFRSIGRGKRELKYVLIFKS